MSSSAVPSLLQRLSLLDTNTVSDALDFLNLPGATDGLMPLWSGPAIVGRATTIQLGKKQDDKPTTHLIAPVIDAINSGVNNDYGNKSVLVIAGGVSGVSCWGDILANAAVTKGVRGSIIDGYCRDIAGSEAVNYPVYGKGITMISARNRIVQVSAGKPVEMAGTTVHSGDYVIADRCGTVFIPAVNTIQVIALAEKIQGRQEGMVAEVRSGRAVSEVMHDKAFTAIYETSGEL